jgi:hypothetical protein
MVTSTSIGPISVEHERHVRNVISMERTYCRGQRLVIRRTPSKVSTRPRDS